MARASRRRWLAVALSAAILLSACADPTPHAQKQADPTATLATSTVPPVTVPVRVTPPPTALPGLPGIQPIRTLQFVNDADGWLVEQGQTILLTTDGGLTWHTSDTSPDELRSLDFTGPEDGWVLTNGGSSETNTAIGLLRTTDGGRSWTTLGEPPGAVLAEIDFSGSTAGWAITTVGTLVDTTDGGARWSAVTAPLAGSVCVTVSGQVWLGVTDGDVEDSIDGGATWQTSLSWDSRPAPTLHPGNGLPPSPIAPLMTCAGSRAWALYDWGEAAGSSAYIVYTTSDAGSHWDPQLASEDLTGPTGPLPNVSASIADIGVSNGGSAWFLGYCGPCGVGTAEIVTTDDASIPRTAQLPELTDGALDASFADPAHGWVVGLDAATPPATGANRLEILVTDDGGGAWRPIVTLTLTS